MVEGEGLEVGDDIVRVPLRHICAEGEGVGVGGTKGEREREKVKGGPEGRKWKDERGRREKG